MLAPFTSKVAGISRAVDGVRFNLKEKSAQPQQGPASSESSSGHVMISYSWENKDRMRQLAVLLKEAGLRVWLDIEQMTGSLLGHMAEAVEEASVIVIGLSKGYRDSQACRTEASYAYQLKKKMIFVMAEDGYSAKGWVGALLSGHLYYSPFRSDGSVDMQPIMKALSTELAAATSASLPQQQQQQQQKQQQQQPVQRQASTASALQATNLQAAGRTASTAALSTGVASAPVRGFNYTNVTLPANTELPLSADELKRSVSTWSVSDTCRFLVMNKMSDLAPVFVLHNIDGVALEGAEVGVVSSDLPFRFPSLPFLSLPFPFPSISFPFPSLPFPSLPFLSFPFPSLPFPSFPFPFHFLPFPSLPFPSLPLPSLPLPSSLLLLTPLPSLFLLPAPRHVPPVLRSRDGRRQPRRDVPVPGCQRRRLGPAPLHLSSPLVPS
jgi:hypothetical protein